MQKIASMETCSKDPRAKPKCVQLKAESIFGWAQPEKNQHNAIFKRKKNSRRHLRRIQPILFLNIKEMQWVLFSLFLSRPKI